MKRPGALFICGTAAFALIAVGYLTGYLTLSRQSERIAQLETQTQAVLDTQTKLHKDLAKLDSALKKLKTADRNEIKGILLKIDGITDEIQDWKNEYTAFLDNIKKGIDNLTSVDLGKVEVQKENEQQKQQ